MITSAPFILRDLDITFPRGAVTLIAGKFGCGKSLLLNAILGEVALLRGQISYAVSPVADPWEAESSAEWGRCFQGLAFVPQVSDPARSNVSSSLQDCMAAESQYQVSSICTIDRPQQRLLQGQHSVWTPYEH
jgi:ABC-type cobalamin/Fe3+-siderophores transport system ATPase subunit